MMRLLIYDTLFSSERYRYHGLRGSTVATSCCISDEPCQWETANFEPHSSEVSWPIVLKFKFKKHVQRATQHAKYGSDRNKADAQIVTVFGSTLLFLYFFCILRTASWPHGWTDFDAPWLIARVFRQGSAFWGSRCSKLDLHTKYNALEKSHEETWRDTVVIDILLFPYSNFVE